ncbi:MAG: toll/interleukin-1 receptor domain-containing protein [Nitrospira sp.]|nr:toll/interleukin-1 receptor domain-containing protein [Nitrospira sp.]
MPDCFISYSSTDQEFAKSVYSELEKHTITAFMASVSLQPGQDWSKEIMENLRNSKWVILLASRAACSSEFVNQEIGATLHNAKNLIPIVWDMAPSELPGWANGVQAIDMSGKQTVGELQREIASIAQRIKQDKSQGLLIIGVVFLALFVLSRE